MDILGVEEGKAAFALLTPRRRERKTFDEGTLAESSSTRPTASGVMISWVS